MKLYRSIFIGVPVIFLVPTARSATAPVSVVEAYAARSAEQSERLRGASMQVEIEASLPKLQKKGRLHALRHISRLGRITYEILHFEGDNTIRNNVIARYLTAEAQGNEAPDLAVTPVNYKFKYKGELNQAGRAIYIFQLSPKKKVVGLFKGELWLDADTCLPVREAGRLVKNPSVFVRQIEFVREYDIQDGVAIPILIRSTVDTRLVGKAELTIRFSDVSLAASAWFPIEAASGQ
jgi:hypothetical protein